MAKTKVMIVDDQFVARQLFEMYVKSSERYELVYAVESAAFADTFVLKNNIDLVLMDILMNDGSNGLEAAARIKKNRPDIKIIAVTSMPEASWLKKAREIGIESFWYKESSRETILEVMDRTMAGESVYPDSTPTVKLGHIDSGELTERELEVLRIMTTGVSNAAIAKELGITENTVKNHIRHMMEKTGCTSRTALAIEARVSGVVVHLTH
ncbi:LuxR C-terminal-related transcriptional regulator [Faecalicatena contorta]|uniref:response regulator transcription factor n=1 Tax=Faecalicatena contorta TaxID=39482 RepID=UPI001F32FA5E|nr:response regulator transcription factor [Faecalicatena contorta]MCF2554581.1 response regulator transcription factor [Faecalicatena contorta]